MLHPIKVDVQKTLVNCILFKKQFCKIQFFWRNFNECNMNFYLTFSYRPL